MTRGGGAGRIARPELSPMQNSVLPVTKGRMSRSFRRRREQLSQNRRPVQGYQCRRTIFSPHSEQKFGRYIAKAPGLECEDFPAWRGDRNARHTRLKPGGSLGNRSWRQTVSHYSQSFPKDNTFLRSLNDIGWLRIFSAYLPRNDKQLDCCFRRPRLTPVADRWLIAKSLSRQAYSAANR